MSFALGQGSSIHPKYTQLGAYSVPLLKGWHLQIIRGPISSIKYTAQQQDTHLILKFVLFQPSKGIQPARTQQQLKQEAQEADQRANSLVSLLGKLQVIQSKPMRFHNLPAYLEETKRMEGKEVITTRILRFTDGYNEYWVQLIIRGVVPTKEDKKLAEEAWTTLQEGLRPALSKKRMGDKK